MHPNNSKALAGLSLRSNLVSIQEHHKRPVAFFFFFFAPQQELLDVNKDPDSKLIGRELGLQTLDIGEFSTAPYSFQRFSLCASFYGVP